MLWLGLSAAAVQAHAVLQSASPESGVLLDSAPTEAVLHFNEGVSPLAVMLIAPDGAQSDLTAQAEGGDSLRVPLSLSQRGTYVLSWRVVSADGHPIPGAQIFSVGKVTAAAPEPAGYDLRIRILMWAARLVLTAGLVVAVGGALFGVFAPLAPRARRIIAASGLAALSAAPLYLGLHGADALGKGLAALPDPAVWRAAWATSFGPATALAALSVLLALAALRRPRLAVAAYALAALSFALAGHASAADPQLLMRPLVFLHLAALVFWIGSLVPLAVSLRAEGETAGKTGGDSVGLARFAAVIPAALLVLLGSGIMLMVVQLGPDPAKWLTPYGYLLGAKLGLVALLFALGAVNRWWLTAPARAGEPRAIGRLRKVIGVEIAVALVILGLAAGWRFTPPPRALAQAPATLPNPPEAFLHIHEQELMASLLAKPGGPGPVAVEIFLNDGEMEVVTPLAVTLGVALPDKGVARVAYPARVDADGTWQIPEVMLPLAGDWQVDLEIRMSRFKLVTLGGVLEIR